MKSRLSPKTGLQVTRWIILPAILLAGGLLLASNVVLQSRAVRGWFERKLEHVSGLDWTIEYLSWTPWTGIQVGQVGAQLRRGRERGAEPVYQAGEIDVRIYWAKLLHGELALREVRLRKGRVAIPIELMALLPEGKGPLEPPVAAPEQGDHGNQGEQVGPPASSESLPVPGDPDPAQVDRGPNEDPRGKSRGGKSAGGERVAKADAPPVRPPAGPPVRFRMEECEVSLYSISGKGKHRLALRGVEAELPLAGEDSQGWLSAKGLTMAGEAISDPFQADVQWKRPYLFVPLATFEWSGLTIQAGGSVRVGGAPVCTAQVRILPSALEPTPLRGWSGLEVAAANVEMLGRFNGNLLEIRSWRGDTLVQVQGLQLEQKERGEQYLFDYGRVTAAMRGGVAQLSDARLLSERLSFLGNGLVLPNGRVLGVLRVVADREHAERITKVAVGSFLAGGWTQSWFTPLITPDRYYRDINVRGTMSKSTVDVGKKGEELEVDQAWERMMAFVKNEVEETKHGVPPSAPRERIRAPQ